MPCDILDHVADEFEVIKQESPFS